MSRETDTHVLRKYVLERLHVYAEEHISSVNEVNADVFFLVDGVTERLVVRLQGHILAEKRVGLTQDVTFEVFESWWGHFKFRFFPRWAYRRWPAHMRTIKRSVHFAEYASFPEFDPASYPAKFGPVTIVQTAAVS